MAWELPIEVYDPNNVWDNKANILDGDISTFVKYNPVVDFPWSELLTVIYSHTVSGRVKFYLVLPDHVFDCIVGIYDGFEWTVMPSVTLDEFTGWHYVAFAKQEITQVAVRFNPGAALALVDGISVVAVEVACTGPLVPICDFLHSVGIFFTDLASDIRELWLVGEYLAGPFENLGEFFQDGADICCTASGTLQDILDALEGGVTPESLLALIEDYWPALYYFITDFEGWFEENIVPLLPELPAWLDDPVAYITETVSPLIPDLPDWLDDPIAWFVENILPLLPELPEWPEDPLEWLASVLEEHWPALYYLAVDPEGEVRYLIGQWFGWEPYQVSSWDLIFKAIMETWFPILWELYLDPEGWIEEHVTDAIEKLLEPLREALDALRGQLEEFLAPLFFPGKYIWDGFFGWVDAVQERGEMLMDLPFKPDFEASVQEFEATVPYLDELIALIEQDMKQEENEHERDS